MHARRRRSPLRKRQIVSQLYPFSLIVFSQCAFGQSDTPPVKTEKMLIPVVIDGKSCNLGGLPTLRSTEVEDRLCAAAGIYGRSSVVPTLWIYTENDNHAPSSVHAWFEAFAKAGGKGTLVIKPSYKTNGHSMVQAPSLLVEDSMEFLK